MRFMLAALVRCYALSLALVCLSGASPRVCEVSWEPDAGRWLPPPARREVVTGGWRERMASPVLICAALLLAALLLT